MHKFQKLQPPA